MLNLALESKIEESIKILQLASRMSKQYYGKPLIINYSGGKDSDTLLNLALESKIEFEVLNSHTTVDAPPTVKHIREVFNELKKKGIKVEIKIAHYPDGKPITMWNLIEKKKMPPTRIMRYCCYYLKEQTTPNRFVATGVRKDESTARREREAFETQSSKKSTRIHKTLAEAEEVYEEANDGIHDEAWDCMFITKAKQNKDLICNPIIDWTEKDVWDYIHDRKIKYNPLYDKGYRRVGCVGCPMASLNQRRREFSDFPMYRKAFIRAFDRMLEARKKSGKDSSNYDVNDWKHWETGQDVFDWWLMSDRTDQVKGQLEFNFEAGRIEEHHE